MRLLFFAGLFVLSLAFDPSRLTCVQDETNWANNARNLNATRSNPNSLIDPSNVASLIKAWDLNVGGSVSAIPAYWKGKLFFPSFNGNYYSVDAGTGVPIWNISGLGLSKTTPVVGDDVVIFGTQELPGGPKLYALNTNTGAIVWSVILSTHPYAVITQSGTRVCDVFYVGTSSVEEFAPLQLGPCCTFQGHFFAIDVNNGNILWDRPMTTSDYPGVGVWGSSPSIDLALGNVYIATGDGYDGPATVKLCLLFWSYEQCVPNNTYANSVLALDLYTGGVKWSYRAWDGDWWNAKCFVSCPKSPNPVDYDFGQEPMLFKSPTSGRKLLGLGDKGGRFLTLDAVTGQIVWITQVGPGGKVGGLQWGSATDGKRIYVALANSEFKNFTLPSGESICYGAYGALNIDTGAIIWLVKDPSGAALNAATCLIIQTIRGMYLANLTVGQTPVPMGPVSVGNGVVYGSTLNGYMYAFNAANGNKLWEFYSPDQASLNTAPAIIGNAIYFGTGYNLFNRSSVRPGTKFYSFKLP